VPGVSEKPSAQVQLIWPDMKAMVMRNIKTDLDITNGVRGEIIGIVFNMDEPSHSRNQPMVQLKCLPAYVLVKMTHTRASQLDGVEEAVILVKPAMTTQVVYTSPTCAKTRSETLPLSYSPNNPRQVRRRLPHRISSQHSTVLAS